MRSHHDDDEQQLAALAHELTNALAVIGGHAKIIERRLTHGSTLDPFLVGKEMAIISTAVRRSVRLVALMRDGSRHQDPPPITSSDGTPPPADR